ncbi:hypothetical protein KO489_15285 [Reinekea forsetii]|nr:hypothetical protein [Reinekea forsetii]
MDLLGLICNFLVAMGIMYFASNRMFQNIELKHLMLFVVAAYIVLPIPTFGAAIHLIAFVTCLVKWGDTSGFEALAYVVGSFVTATLVGDFTAYVIQSGSLPPSLNEYFSDRSI